MREVLAGLRCRVHSTRSVTVPPQHRPARAHEAGTDHPGAGVTWRRWLSILAASQLLLGPTRRSRVRAPWCRPPGGSSRRGAALRTPATRTHARRTPARDPRRTCLAHRAWCRRARGHREAAAATVGLVLAGKPCHLVAERGKPAVADAAAQQMPH